MLTNHTYRLLKGASWGIVITLRGEVVPTTVISRSAVKVSGRIWMQIDVKWRLSDQQVDHLKRGLLLVAGEIERTVSGETPILVHVTGLEYNPTDYQPEGLIAAVAEWAARACGFPTPRISATFDQSRRRYVFDFEIDAADHPQFPEMRTRIDITASPSTWVAESALAVLRHFWVNAHFQPMGCGETKPLREFQFVLGGATVRNFLIIPHHGERRETDKATALSTSNREVRFVVGSGSSFGVPSQILTVLCDERTEEIERLKRSLEQTLWGNEMATQGMSHIA